MPIGIAVAVDNVKFSTKGQPAEYDDRRRASPLAHPPMESPNTPRILITGASRGFGAALAVSFAQRGARVFAGARHPRPVLEHIAARHPESITIVDLDVSDGESVRRASKAVAARERALDIVVNNAAIRSPTVANPIESIDFADVARTLDVNAVGPLRVVQAFLPMLRAGHSPLLVNVSSEAGSIGPAGRDREFDYCMSKAALNMATRLLSNYLAGAVRVLALHPGWLRTDMGGSHAALDPQATAEIVADRLLLERSKPSAFPFIDYEGNPLPW
jgi:NAD(P)-dependent dehydrogenase (short-subunit alcohol dehydrogenase family)